MGKEKSKLVKKIFIDGHSFDTSFQGTTSYLIGLYSSLMEDYKDIEIHIGTKNPKNVQKYFNNYQNIKFIKYKSNISFLRIFFEIPSIIKKNKFDFAHFQYVIPFSRSKGCKYFVTIHDILFEDFENLFPFFYKFTRKILFKYAAKNADKVFTVSKYSKSRIEKLYNINPKKIEITFNGINDMFYYFQASKNQSKDYILKKYGLENYLLYVSRIEPRKNHTSLIKTILNTSIDNSHKVVFIGENSLIPDFEKIISKANKRNKKFIYWYRNVALEDLLHFYNAGEAFIFPSLAEGFGIPPLEAAIMNIPVLCSNQTAMSDFVFFEPHSFDPRNQKEFESKLLSFINGIKNIDTEKIKNDIIKKYNWKESSSVFYEQLI